LNFVQIGPSLGNNRYHWLVGDVNKSP